jgi:hypothetical protein
VKRQGGQVLAFFAVALPAVLLPVAAYAVDAAVVSGQAAQLQSAAAQAAEVAAQQVDVAMLRSTGALQLDRRAAQLAASQTLVAEMPDATVDEVAVGGVDVTVQASERVALPVPLLTRNLVLHARAVARLIPGYDRPSSLLPLPTNSF